MEFICRNYKETFFSFFILLILFGCKKTQIITPTLSTLIVDSITNKAAISGGEIFTDGGARVTERGICWDTINNPTIILQTKTKDGSGVGKFSSFLKNLKPGFDYYVRAYATNSAGTAYGNEVVFRTKVQVGDTLSGGIVAYILEPKDSGYESNLQHGLIASFIDQTEKITSIYYPGETGCMWQKGTYLNMTTIFDTTYTRSSKIGTGRINTNRIIQIQNSIGRIFDAANYADKYSFGNYTDWYLPSSEELMKLYLNRSKIGSFAVSWYWSSTESNDAYALAVDFSRGVLGEMYKGPGGTPVKVRAIRYF